MAERDPILRPEDGVIDADAELPGNASVIPQPPTHPSRQAKGDLPQEVPKLGRGLTKSGLSHAGPPFKNLK
jgi:hypothetical protein